MFDPDDFELHEAQKHACKMAKERDEARVMVGKLTAELAACAAALPGAYYMDPPDGGDTPVSEQVRRMANDASAEIVRLRKTIEDAAEAAEILDNLSSSVQKHGSYSKDATLLFLSHARSCLNGLTANVELTGVPSFSGTSSDQRERG